MDKTTSVNLSGCYGEPLLSFSFVLVPNDLSSLPEVPGGKDDDARAQASGDRGGDSSGSKQSETRNVRKTASSW